MWQAFYLKYNGETPASGTLVINITYNDVDGKYTAALSAAME